MPPIASSKDRSSPERNARRSLLAFAVACSALVTVPSLLAPTSAGAVGPAPISAGDLVSCAVMADETVQCWGDAQGGMLGDGGVSELPNPTPTPVPGVSGVKSVTVGYTHVCVAHTNGTVTCWGDNDTGTFGNGVDGVDDQPPTPIPGVTDVFQIGIGNRHTCYLTNAGAVSCTGDNGSGEIGVDPGSSSRETTPVPVPGLAGIVDLASNDGHNCALDSVGTVRCWGTNSDGELGNATTTDNHVPQVVALPAAASDVATGGSHSCAVLTTGAVWCWGEGSDGQLGNGAATESSSPVLVTGIGTATAVALGDRHSCAVLANMTAVCWGYGSFGVLGNGDDSGTDQPTPVAVTGISGITHLSGLDDHMCARTSDGGASCWGSGSSAELGLDILRTRPQAYQVSTLNPVDLAVGGSTLCLRQSDATVHCRGSNSQGELGRGTTGSPSASFAPVGGLTNVVGLDSHSRFSCAVRTDGTVHCWGINGTGQHGNGTTTGSATPVAVTGITTADRVTTASRHTCVTLLSDEARCWGQNFPGRLGDGTTSLRLSPVAVSGLATAAGIAAASDHTCAILTDGTARCWGENGDRQLGNGPTTDSTTPVVVASVANAVTIEAGDDHTCAVTSASEVWCWGESIHGRLGAGSGSINVPVKMTGINTASEVATAGSNTCVLLASGRVNCTGLRGKNGIGGVSKNVADSPVIDVDGNPLEGITTIDGYGDTFCAIRNVASGGGVFCWGETNDGVFGYLNFRSAPVSIMLPQTVGTTTTTTTTTSTTTSTTTTTTTSTSTSTTTTTPPTTTTVPSPDPTPVFVAVAPARLVDTRSTGMTIDAKQQGDGQVAANGRVTVTVAGRANVPSNAAAAIVNITAIRPTGTGFVTAHPCKADVPNTASLNYTSGISLGNETIVELDSSGNMCLFTSAATDVAVDVVAYLPAGAPYVPVGPSRLTDTRDNGSAATVDDRFEGEGRRADGSTYRIEIGGRSSVPKDAAAAVINVAAIRPSGTGFLTIHPCLPTAPNAASLNYVAGVNRGNEIIAPLSATGEICVFTSAATDISVDVVGYLSDATYTPATPQRLLDTRNNGSAKTIDGNFEADGVRSAGQSTRLDVAGRGTIPANAKTVTINITAIGATGIGYVTVHACLPTPPNASSLNHVAGVNGGNEVVAQLDANGDLCLFTSSPTNLTVDVAGYTT